MAFYSNQINRNKIEPRISCPEFENSLILESLPNQKYRASNTVIIYNSFRDTNKKARCSKNSEATIERFTGQSNEPKNKDHFHSNHSNGSDIFVGDGLHIPKLSLNFSESLASNENECFSYSKIKEVTKNIEKPNAFEEWFKAKQAKKLYESKLKKELELKKQMEKLERKGIAQEQFQEWLKKKLEKEKFEKKKNEGNKEKIKLTKCSNNPTEEDRKKCFELWLKNKIEKERVTQQKYKEKLIKEQEQKIEREQQAKILYDEWSKTAPFKPRPVPLNKGLLTLKGTISDLFINPEPWKT
ncbi:reticulocyte-binding protein homolog 2a-like [Condylostylus longicornis]|uniref:reticulocyte-binding protein homolog 2a-like n=1 Tax=Condylostylus longicornis TaxID=2530218 RepID=UPI00244E4437|nr:reticulocyte-binding protein homolog 2a-like [Condylostylus longicornis]